MTVILSQYCCKTNKSAPVDSKADFVQAISLGDIRSYSTQRPINATPTAEQLFPEDILIQYRKVEREEIEDPPIELLM